MVILTIYRHEIPGDVTVTPEMLSEVLLSMEELKRPDFVGIRRINVQHYMSRTMVEVTADVQAGDLSA